MGGFTADVDVNELIVLQSELLKLSGNLKEIYIFLNSDLRKLSYGWQDRKFMEFEEKFEPIKEEIRKISESYEIWAKGALKRTIDKLIEVDDTSMG